MSYTLNSSKLMELKYNIEVPWTWTQKQVKTAIKQANLKFAYNIDILNMENNKN